MRILILDDDRSYGALLASASKKLGHRAIVKVDAQEAVQMLRNKEADIALVDLEMPNGSGTAFAKTLRKNGITVPVAFCTGTCRDLQLIEEAQSMGQVLPKIWTHADLRVILSALQLESNSLNRMAQVEADNSEITERNEDSRAGAEGSNDRRRSSYVMPVNLDSSQEISRHGGPRPDGSRPGYRPSSREMARPSSREISIGAREDLRLPQMRQAPEVLPPPVTPAPSAPPARPTGPLSQEELMRAYSPTSAPPIAGAPAPSLAEPEDFVDSIPPPPSHPPIGQGLPPPLDLSPPAQGLPPPLDLGLPNEGLPPPLDLSPPAQGLPPPLDVGSPPLNLDAPPLELDAPSALGAPVPRAESPLPPDHFDPMDDADSIDINLPSVPTNDRPGLSVDPLSAPDPFNAPATQRPEPAKKRLDEMLEVGDALRETPRVNIGCSNWEQVRRLCGDVMRGMSTITVRARCEMRSGEDVVVALELPDEMVVSIAARVLDFRERSSDGKRPYQLDLIGFGSDEIAYLLDSCEANGAQADPAPAAAAPVAAPAAPPTAAPPIAAPPIAAPPTAAPPTAAPGPAPARRRGPPPAAAPPPAKAPDLPPARASGLPPGMGAKAEPEPDQGQGQGPAIPDAIDAVDSEASYEEKGPSISWS